MQHRHAASRWALFSALALTTTALAQHTDRAEPGAAPLESAGAITEVTVYRGQAMVTRTIDIDVAPGLREVILTDLPARILPDSLYAESDRGIQVRSLTYRERPVRDDVRDEVRQIEDRIAQLEQQIRANRHNQQLLTKQSTYLDRVENFSATTAVSDLAHGLLEPGAVQDVSAYIFEQRQRIADQSLELQEQARDLQQKLHHAQRERNTITGSAAHTAREAVLYLDVSDPAGDVFVHYLVDSATWSPSYTARLDSDTGELRLEYLASIEQRSGEPWNEVNMSLSTATPTLTARAPQIEPFELTLKQMGQQAQLGANYTQMRDRLAQQQQQYDEYRNVAGARAKSPPPSPESAASKDGGGFGGGGGGTVLPWSRGEQPDLDAIDRELNELAQRIQILELSASAADARRKQEDKSMTESLSVTYDLPSRISLASRQGQQLVSVRTLDLDAEAYRMATPVLTEFVYVEANARNDSSIVLLAGPMSSYLDGEFVGRSDLPSIAAGESFTAGFGVDSSLRASREIVNMTEETLGGNRVVEIDYRLTIRSFNGGDVPIRLFDRIPTADDQKVKVSLVSTSQPVSEDEQYLAAQRDKGILRWDLETPDDASAATTMTVEHTLRLEYDKNMTLASERADDDSAG